MKNRIFQQTESIISDKIQSYSLPTYPSFEEADRAFIEEFMKRKIEEARAEGKAEGRKEGAQEVRDQLTRSYEERTNNFFLKIAKILEVVGSIVVNEKFSGKGFAIKEIRLDFNPDLKKMEIKVLFVLEATPEKGIEFAKDLILIEKKFWELEKIPMNLFSVNAKDVTLDNSTIEADFPVRIKSPLFS